jgi:transposase InsO family protein
LIILSVEVLHLMEPALALATSRRQSPPADHSLITPSPGRARSTATPSWRRDPRFAADQCHPAIALHRHDAVRNCLCALPSVRHRNRRQNAYVERLIGSIRRECLDHVVKFGEAHLRRVLAIYAGYYNNVRTHLALGKDAPVPDAPLGRPVQVVGRIVPVPILGGLHHQYVRMA